MLTTSFPPLLDKRAKFDVLGLYEKPFPATPGLYSFGEFKSKAFELARLKTVNFKPKSVNTHISSSVAPKDMCVTFVVADVGHVIVAENFGSLGE